MANVLCSMVIYVALIGGMIMLFLPSHASKSRYPDKAHHAEHGFRNIGYPDESAFSDFRKWQWRAYGRDFPITGRRSTSSQAGGANIAVIYSRWPSQDNQDFHF